MLRTAYISGVHSGPNPSPGIGIARSLRLMWPSATLVAVDYSRSSSGLNSTLFDDYTIFPAWEHIDFHRHAHQVRDCVKPTGTVWISGLDLEARLFSSLRQSPRVVVPPVGAFKELTKPATAVAKALGMHTPPSVQVGDGDHRTVPFIEEWGWPIWIKGRSYEALCAHDWPQLEHFVRRVGEVWGGEVVLQPHISGIEESILFAASTGTLVGSAHMRKLAVTETGKTWSGELHPLEGSLENRLSHWVEQTDWHGGGEVEFVHSPAGEQYVIDVNPRFPAWVHGSSQNGFNLPAGLVQAVLNSSVEDSPSRPARAMQFTRVVQEIPVRTELHGPRGLPSNDGVQSLSGKHPSGMPVLSRRMMNTASREPGTRGVTSNRVLRAIQRGTDAIDVEATPAYYFDLEGFQAKVEWFSRELAPDHIRLAYSIKTNPKPDILKAAHDAGLLAEAITQDEVAVAEGIGWAGTSIVLNGPAKLWPKPLGLSFLAMFADSLEEALEPSVGSSAIFEGPRIRMPGVASRFGIPLDESGVMSSLAEIVGSSSADFALHTHTAQSRIGLRRWYSGVAGILKLGSALSQMIAKPVRMVDFGGGFTEPALLALVENRKRLVDLVRGVAPDCELIVIEPGKGLLASHGMVFSRVIRVLEDDSAIVDASIAELPDRVSQQRPAHVYREGEWLKLGWGPGALFGRTCMEEDLICAQIETSSLLVGDLIVFGNAGAYDVSMRYDFARGR